MNNTHNKKLTPNAKVLRVNMTEEEKHLWYDFLKKLPITINRQKVIKNYIVDFYIAKAKIVIEVDGSQHYAEENKEKDNHRDEELKSLGITVLRYTNLDIKTRFKPICHDILKQIKTTVDMQPSP